MQAYWIVCIVLFLVILPARAAARRARIRRIIRRRRRKGNKDMYDLIQTMLGQEVIVYVSDGAVSTVGGFLRKVEEGWIQVERANHQIVLISVKKKRQ